MGKSDYFLLKTSQGSEVIKLEPGLSPKPLSEVTNRSTPNEHKVLDKTAYETKQTASIIWKAQSQHKKRKKGNQKRPLNLWLESNLIDTFKAHCETQGSSMTEYIDLHLRRKFNK